MADQRYQPAQLRSDINTLLLYNWNDEERDYHQQDEDGRNGHIFNVLRRLRAFASTDWSPDMTDLPELTDLHYRYALTIFRDLCDDVPLHDAQEYVRSGIELIGDMFPVIHMDLGTRKMQVLADLQRIPMYCSVEDVPTHGVQPYDRTPPMDSDSMLQVLIRAGVNEDDAIELLNAADDDTTGIDKSRVRYDRSERALQAIIRRLES